VKIYIAACFGQQAEVREKADDLEYNGHECTSFWRHEKPTGDGSEAVNASKYMQAAMRDLRDIDRSDLLVLLTGQISRTGGKHFELGYAVARGKQVIIVGPCENVFHWLLPRFETWQEFMETLP